MFHILTGIALDSTTGISHLITHILIAIMNKDQISGMKTGNEAT